VPIKFSAIYSVAYLQKYVKGYSDIHLAPNS